MEILNKIFSTYDSAIGPLPVSYQAIISFSILLFLLWIVYIFIKSKNWIFLAVIIVTLPETWPAAKNIGKIIWALFIGITHRIK
jgi:hypothetical protein